jgi:hypothetical protein
MKMHSHLRIRALPGESPSKGTLGGLALFRQLIVHFYSCMSDRTLAHGERARVV